ncbi:uncharacterized protein RCC_04268 [Ramularia collo-cygni]|uniref:Uncharacterized protein n=1 Tax=Ramularia collo-cygni TaxID=112498 RepID=A0A2D3VD09_9PEZI|nr:uncharacterized protein RCC_04268 [Ramularia collo-cygni]CZT18423.1 uncharacterized protein RCC_04268 [Ramularia collo-cygni]
MPDRLIQACCTDFLESCIRSNGFTLERDHEAPIDSQLVHDLPSRGTNVAVLDRCAGTHGHFGKHIDVLVGVKCRSEVEFAWRVMWECPVRPQQAEVLGPSHGFCTMSKPTREQNFPSRNGDFGVVAHVTKRRDGWVVILWRID